MERIRREKGQTALWVLVLVLIGVGNRDLLIERPWATEYEWTGGGSTSTTTCEWTDSGTGLSPRDTGREVTNANDLRTTGPFAVTEPAWVFRVDQDGKVYSDAHVASSTITGQSDMGCSGPLRVSDPAWVFQVTPDGDVFCEDITTSADITMAANHKITMPEATSGPLTWTLSAADCINAATTLDETIATTGVAFASTQTGYFNLQMVPTMINGGRVVLDQVTVWWGEVDSDDYITSWVVQASGYTGAFREVSVDYDTNLTSPAPRSGQNILSADVTLDEFSAYRLAVDIVQNDGRPEIYMIRCVGHVE